MTVSRFCETCKLYNRYMFTNNDIVGCSSNKVSSNGTPLTCPRVDVVNGYEKSCDIDHHILYKEVEDEWDYKLCEEI